MKFNSMTKHGGIWIMLAGILTMVNAATVDVSVKAILFSNVFGPTGGRPAYLLLGALVFLAGLAKLSRENRP